MRKVKIVCTLGPACKDIDILRKLAESGLNVARFNFSHGDYEGHGAMLEMVREVERERDEPIATLLDTKGPEIRTGLLEDHVPVTLKQGDTFRLVTSECEGTSEQVSISYDLLPKEVVVGQDLFIDDGAIHLVIDHIDDDAIACKIVVGGILGEHKGINVPGADLSVPTLTEKDISDIKWGIAHNMDFIAVSFVRSRNDILQVRHVMEEHGGSMFVIAKIETRQAVDNLDEIIQVVDGMMVARGDLGVEMATEDVPMVQKRIIDLCRRNGKPVIVATQMLDSMIRNPRPTRAEASDVANAVLDGTDAVMLSGETASGKYPVEAVQTMVKIVERAEAEVDRWHHVDKALVDSNVADSVSHAAMRVAEGLSASAIISLSRSGSTASMVSKYRPDCSIIAITPLVSTWRMLCLQWGIRAIMSEEYSDTEAAVDGAMRLVVERGYVSEGDEVVITTGFPVFVSGTTNMLLVQTVGRILLRAPSLIKSEAAGFVCKADSAREAIEKMTPGNVLIVSSADMDYMPAFKKASAIITSESGVTNFSAVQALYLGIPCITGVGDEINAFEDGMLVTVDGVHGIVYEGRMQRIL